MPKYSENLNLRLDDPVADVSQSSRNWFGANFGYTDSNMTKIDSAYKAMKDDIADTPTKSGVGATGDWNINVTGSANSAVHDGVGNDISSSYITGISVGNTSITYTKGDGTDQEEIIKTDETLSIKGMAADAKATGDLIKKSVYPTLVVSVTAGSSVTVTKDSYLFSGTTDDKGEVEFNLPALGQWDISASHNGRTVTDFIDIDVLAKKYTISLVYFNANLVVSAPTNAVVTAISGYYQYTETSGSEGNATFDINHAGNYTVTATMNTATSNPVSVDITEDGGNYSAEAVFRTITVTCDSGSSITVQKDEEVLTGNSMGAPVKFYIPSTGSWTVTATLDENVAQGEINVVDFTDYPITLNYAKIFGVVWTYSNSSTALARITKTNDPNNYVNTDITTSPSPAVGAGSGSSPFDDYMPWKGMDEYNIVHNAVGAKRGESGFSRSSNDVMVYIPEFYYKVVNDSSSSKRYFYIADKATTGFEKHPGSGRYVGRYNTYSGIYGSFSTTGSLPYVNMTRDSARSEARSKGNKWALYDYASWCAVWLLYIVEYADWNSQHKIGNGWVAMSSAVSVGGTDSMAYHTGSATSPDASTAVQYRHIENPWGNVSEWIDGINFRGNEVYICTDISKYADDTDTNYTYVGAKPQSNGYISATGYSSTFPWSFYPASTSGSETTYVPDYAYSGSGWRVLCVGGNWNYGSNAGLFCFNANYDSSFSSSYIGARLLFVP
nr:MAG TPA: tail collar fiber protein [Caudoviricetes sp.]